MYKKVTHLRIHAFWPHSRANGPGVRAVIWVQGCSLGCPGCFNRDTHDFSGGKSISIDNLITSVLDLNDSIEGITISGGEPLQQLFAVTNFLRIVKEKTTLSVVLFTGYTWDEIQSMKELEVLNFIDLLIAGRYDQSRRIAHDLIGSANKTLHFLTNRYSLSHTKHTSEAEIRIDAKGQIMVTGINPPDISH